MRNEWLSPLLSDLDDEALDKAIKEATERERYAARDTRRACVDRLRFLKDEKKFRKEEKTNYHVNNSRFTFETDLGGGNAICGNNGLWKVSGPTKRVFVKGGWGEALRASGQLKAADKQEPEAEPDWDDDDPRWEGDDEDEA
jgi:hypothetical protein